MYHAVGQAVPAHRQAAEQYADSAPRAQTRTNLTYSIALSGSADEAEQVLLAVSSLDDQMIQYGFRFTLAVIRYGQGRFAEAINEAERAEQLAHGYEEALKNPLLELRYWLARAAWATGDGLRAARLGVYVAVLAQQQGQRKLSDAATDLLVDIRDKGGISNA